MIKTIKIIAYETPENKPTCARDFNKKQVCQFLALSKFGQITQCSVTNDQVNYPEEGLQFLVPSENCIVWGEQNDSTNATV